MDGMLSQDEINALLNGGVSSDGDGADSSEGASSEGPYSNLLTDDEKDAIGEVANISMGTSATTLYSLVNRKVNITTPVVTVCNWENLMADYERPCVFIRIQYKEGLDGTNILVLKEEDVKIITDLMMGGDGTNTEGELGELHLSAISEAMNQMMGSSATSLSSMLGKMVDISPPEASLVNPTDEISGGDVSEFLAGEFVKISFRMQIGDLVDSSIMQLYPLDFARSLYDYFIGSQEEAAAPPAPEPAPAPAAAPPAPAPQPMGMQGQPMMGMPAQPAMGMQGQPMMGMPAQPMQNVNIQPAQFQSFSGDMNVMQSHENMNLIMDVPLEITVELGRTHKSINEILEFAPGTIIELDRIAGEPIDVLVNGKFVAKGEVVVIEESFGIRVTEIIK